MFILRKKSKDTGLRIKENGTIGVDTDVLLNRPDVRKLVEKVIDAGIFAKKPKNKS